MIQYFELRKMGTLKEFLKYFPEKSTIFNEYRSQLHDLSNEIYSYYKRLHIHKSISKDKVPFHLKPLIKEIHNNYLKTKKPTSWNDIKDYTNNLPSKRVTFVLNYKNKKI